MTTDELIAAVISFLFLVGVIAAVIIVVSERRSRQMSRPSRPISQTSVTAVRNRPPQQSTPRRMPHRANTSGSTLPRSTATTYRTYNHTSGRRQPRSSAGNNDYLSFRKCPRCRSKNEFQHQKIYKTGDSYHCTCCDYRFKS